MHRPFIHIAYLGLAVIAGGLLLKSHSPAFVPWMPDGLRTPMLAFEFLETEEEVTKFFGVPDTNVMAGVASPLDMANYIDFGFMIIYTGMLFGFARMCHQRKPSRRFLFLMALAVFIFLADLVETIALLNITAGLAGQDFGGALILLKIFTWLKWGGLALYFLVLSRYFFQGNAFAKGVGVAAFLPAILGISAFFHRSALNEFFGLSITIMFLLIIIYSFTFREAVDRSKA